MVDYPNQPEWDKLIDQKSPAVVVAPKLAPSYPDRFPKGAEGPLPSPQLTPDQFVKWVQRIATTPTPEQWAYILDTANNVTVKVNSHAS